MEGVILPLFVQSQKPIPPEAKESALAASPGFLELFGQCYFFGGFLVGPQVLCARGDKTIATVNTVFVINNNSNDNNSNNFDRASF